MFFRKIEGDLLGDFLLEDVEDKQRTSRRETAEDALYVMQGESCELLG